MATVKKELIEAKQAKTEPPVLAFESPGLFEAWMEENYTRNEGIWLRFYKKGSGVTTVTYDEALDVALCFGWIDGQLKKYDDLSYIQKFTPRRTKSLWSARNVEHIARLEKEGRIRPSGLKEVEAAKADGRWEKAYASPGKMELPEDFLAEVARDEKTAAFFQSLTKANKYAIAWRLQTAVRPETREKRMKQILEMLAKQEKFH